MSTNEETGERVVILGGTSLRLLRTAEDAISMLEKYMHDRIWYSEDKRWVESQQRYISKLREANPKE